MNTHDLYQQQLRYIFDREVSEPPWFQCYGVVPDPFKDDPLRAFEFIERLCQHPEIDLAPYSDAQVGIGLDYIFFYALASGFKEADVPIKRREQALRELFVLFRDVLNPRCEAITLAFSKEPSSKIQSVCYMFWDVCCLSSWIKFTNADEIAQSFLASLSESDFENMNLPESVLENMRRQIAQPTTTIKTPDAIAADVQQQYKSMDAETAAYYKAIASVMQRCLGLSNPACVESGLHGLGHLAAFLPHIAVPIIDQYLARQKDKNSNLAQYAQIARTGMIL